jgi:valyl-tRNA synthetase
LGKYVILEAFNIGIAMQKKTETELSKSFQPTSIEKKWYNFWEENHFFTADPLSEKPAFSLVMPPPNVTGALHAGHALGRTIEDTLVRWKRMLGYEALWIPGTDHAGIATQTVVEQHLRKTKGIRRGDLSREEFLSHIWEWKEKHQSTILSQLKFLGCSCDWSRLRFTLDDQSNCAVRNAFKNLYDANLIYRGDYLVNWDTISQTAISDDEVEFEEKQGFLWYFKYPLKQSFETITIATTRPETLLGDVAVAVSPKDPRYASFIGKTVILPLTQREIPILADDFVDPEFGTGAVKITPAHDANDYEMGRRHHLKQINIMTPDGKINENGGVFQGMTMLEARGAVVKEMEASGLLDKIEPHTLRVGVSYRSKAVIEPYLSKQWFIKMSSFSKQLREVVQSDTVKLIPSYWQNTYFHWIDNLRDWCISRQLVWGHRIPIWYNKEDPEKMICYSGEGLPKEVEENPDLWRQDEDVLDTWFSSGLWPFSTMGWDGNSEKNPLLKKFYPLSTMITGHDILFFWVARMIMMGAFNLKEAPFKEVYLSSLIFGKSYWKKTPEGETIYLKEEERREYDQGKPLPKDVFTKWEKMSKTKGNVIDPVEMIASYGADATRMALCASATQSFQIDLDKRRFDEFKNFSNKIWNGARFVFMHLDNGPALTRTILSEGLNYATLRLEDQWILSVLSETVESVNKALTDYQFDLAATLSYDFFWKDFCAYYLEVCKPFLFGKKGTELEQMQKKKILCVVLSQSIRLLHPMAPFITEELFSALKARFDHNEACDQEKMVDPFTKETLEALKSKACITSPYPLLLDKTIINPKVKEDFSFLCQLVYIVRNILGEMQIPPALGIDLYVSGNLQEEKMQLIEKNKEIIESLVRLNNLHIQEFSPHFELASSAVLGEIGIAIPLPETMQLQEKERLLKEKEKTELKREKITLSLSNISFIENAPKEVVLAQRQQLERLDNELKLILDKLEKIKI